jgi:hypothetical protein
VKALKIISGLLAVFLSLPITFYLWYSVLKRVDASELMWFLFWVNLPVMIVVQIISKLTEKAGD